jgi:hypothetical protein
MSVRYRKSLSDNWSYIDADSYKLLNVSDCYSTTYVGLTVARAVAQNLNKGGYRTQFNQSSPNEIAVYSVITDYIYRIGGTFTLNNPNPLVVVFPEIKIFSTSTPNGSAWQSLGTNTGNGIYFPKSEFDAGNYSINFRQPGDPFKSPCNGCRLIAYKQGLTVFNQAFLSCPYAEIGDFLSCPPGTCDVLCGNTICCYGSNGVSVFNYPNT